MLQPVDASGICQWSREVVQTPVGDLLGPLEVFVSRLAERLDKQVAFTIEGTRLPVDPEAVQPVLSNLTHLFRNALDHGLEPAWDRAGKPETGQLNLTFEADAEDWIITLSDDGRGVCPQTVARLAVERGVVTQAQAAEMSDSDKLELILVDGLSSAQEATSVSGRGVGMAAVRAAVHGQGGSLDFQSTPGQGTKVTMRLPRPTAPGLAMEQAV